MSILDRLFAGEHLVLDARVREKLPGKTVWLSDGVTYYEEGGLSPGQPVILIHGFSGFNFIWDPTFAGLSVAGVHVVRYDLFGRGYSDRPRLQYDKAFFVRQLVELMDALQIERADLVSLSMGGLIAAEFTFRFPRRVGQMIFIDPAGFEPELPSIAKGLRLPILGEVLLGLIGRFGMRKLIDTISKDLFEPTQKTIDFFVSRYLEQMKYFGFQRALLSTMRSGLLDEDLLSYRRLGQLGKEVLLIWGREDRAIPFRHSDTFLKLVPHAQLRMVEHAGHIPHFEQPELVNQILVDFLARASI